VQQTEDGKKRNNLPDKNPSPVGAYRTGDTPQASRAATIVLEW